MQTVRITSVVVVAATLLLTIGLAEIAYADSHLLKRRVAPMRVYTELPDGADHECIVFKLREGLGSVELVDGRFVRSGDQWDLLNEIISSGNGVESVGPRISLPPSILDRMRAEGSQRIGWQLPDMSLYHEIRLASGLCQRGKMSLLNRLVAHGHIEAAYFPPIPIIPGIPEVASSRDLGETPDFESGQYHLKPAPTGVNAYYAWGFPGGRGENVKVIDIEGNWTETHEDLRGGTDSFHIAGERWDGPEYWGHGTAVLGLIAADSNSFGMTGIAYNAELGTVAVDAVEFPGIANCLLTASANADVGDIILIECATGWEMSEYVQENFDAILTISALGQIVVEVASNFDIDYDDTSIYDSLFYPEYRFSGAIVVGASYADHVPDPRTCYGVRLDVHAFGCFDIYSLGNGYLFGTNPDNHYSDRFSGTSGASAIIAGVCAAVQGVHKEKNGYPLDHAGMRELLTTYSTPQVEHEKHIGPMPDLAGICDAIMGIAAPAAPVLVSPDDDDYYNSPAQLILDWEDVVGATSYQVMIDNNPDFLTPEGQAEGVLVSEWVSPEISTGGYFWRVRASDGTRFGLWSEARTILVGTEIAAPALLWPADGAKIPAGDDETAGLEWQALSGADGYWLELYDNPSLRTPYNRVYVSYCGADNPSYHALVFPGTYYWRVKAADGDWPWSDMQSFRVDGFKGRTPNTTDKVVASDIGQLSNYPNPFNPATEISFSLPQACHAKLEIFNMIGQKVATLVDRQLNAGQHSFTWDGTGAATGMYMYRLTAGDIVESRKMLLLK